MKIARLHWSLLKLMAQSPAHVLYAATHEFDPTPHMRFGTLCHALTLGGDVVVYEGERRGNAWKAFQAEHEGRFIVTSSEHAEARVIADAVLSDPVAAPLLAGRHEVAWEANMFGRPCGGRIDVAGPATVDLKTTNDASPFRFANACRRMAYHAQLAWYSDARRALGEDPGEAFIVGVETKPPYLVTVFRVTPRMLEEGRKLNRLWLERLEACERANEWPGYVQSALDLDVVEDVDLIIDGEEIAA